MSAAEFTFGLCLIGGFTAAAIFALALRCVDYFDCGEVEHDTRRLDL